jgi:hypothetical protein
MTFRRWLLTALLLPALIVFTVASESEMVESAPIDIRLFQPGPHGPITVLGDSVLLGSGAFSPTLPDRLREAGWGPIRFRAGEGYTSGSFAVPSTFKVSDWITRWRAEGWDPANVVINIGANDSGFCNTDLTCARNAILHVVNAIGPGHQIWWPQVTRLFTHFHQQDTWNTALRQIAAERPDFHTWDWPTVMQSEGFASHDGTHLAPDGYRRRSLRMAGEITADLARGSRVGGDAPLPNAATGPSTFTPVSPIRVVDTRTQSPGRRPPGSTLRVDLFDHLGAGVDAVAVNVTAAGASTAGYLQAAPCGTTVSGSTVNFTPGVARGAMTIVPLGDQDDICITTSADVDIIVDLQGEFTVGSTGAKFTPLPTLQRLHDTRNTGRRSLIELAAPAGSSAVALGLTATRAAEPGWIRAFPCDEPATSVSNVNFLAGEAVAGSAFVPVSATGRVCVMSNVSVDVIVDLTGTFADGGDLRFVAAPPTRSLDTRDAVGGWSPIHGRNQTIDARVVPPDADAVTGTLTIVGPLRRSFLTASDCAGDPPTSSVNAVAGLVLATSITTGVSAGGRLCVTAAEAGQTLFDTSGWWVP